MKKKLVQVQSDYNDTCMYAYGCHSAYPIQGSNYMWYCDGYNKLKPYGFPIHGCIDGLVPKYNNYNL